MTVEVGNQHKNLREEGRDGNKQGKEKEREKEGMTERERSRQAQYRYCLIYIYLHYNFSSLTIYWRENYFMSCYSLINLKLQWCSQINSDDTNVLGHFNLISSP